MTCRGRNTYWQPHTSRARNGLKFFAYTWLPFVGRYTEDGLVLRGTQSQSRGNTGPVQIPALSTPAPKNCCGLVG